MAKKYIYQTSSLSATMKNVRFPLRQQYVITYLCEYMVTSYSTSVPKVQTFIQVEFSCFFVSGAHYDV